MNPDEQMAVKRLLAPFSERPLEVLEPAARIERRDRVVSGIQAILDEPVQARTWARLATLPWVKISSGLALAAGFALLVGRVWSPPTERGVPAELRALSARGDILCTSTEVTGYVPCDPTKQTALTGVRTLNGASIYLETQVGARLALDPLTTLELPRTTGPGRSDCVVRLSEGRADVTVPKLGSGRAFAVQTPSATVTVHGTAFSVTVTRESNEVVGTCVELREGVVSVESKGRTVRLDAPARWGCTALTNTNKKDNVEHKQEATEAFDEAHENIDRDATERTPGGAALPSATTPGATSKQRSSLSREIRLLQQGLGAEQKRDLKVAEASYRALLRLYPNSVVAPEARAALERIHGQAPATK